MSVFAVRWASEPLRTVGFEEIVDAAPDYIPIGTGLLNPARMIGIQNLTDAHLFFSLNGVDDNFILPAGNSLFLDLCSDKTTQAGYYMASVGQIVFVRCDDDAEPTMGSVYVTTFYAAQ